VAAMPTLMLMKGKHSLPQSMRGSPTNTLNDADRKGRRMKAKPHLHGSSQADHPRKLGCLVCLPLLCKKYYKIQRGSDLIQMASFAFFDFILEGRISPTTGYKGSRQNTRTRGSLHARGDTHIHFD
jgi:hypothetical protein